MKLLFLVLMLLPTLAAAQPAEPPPEPRACIPACRDGFSCIDGTCVSSCNPPCGFNETCTGNAPAMCRRVDPVTPPPPPPPPPAATTTTTIIAPPPFAPPAPTSIDNSGSFHVNLIGVLQLGPTVALEFGGRTTFAARFRAMNAGALSYVIVADGSSGDTLGFSYGVAGTLRHYYGREGNQRGFFVGSSVEYISTHVEEEERVAYDTQLIVPQFELGYRWVSGNFLFELGGGLGYAIVLTAESSLIDEGGTLFENDAENGPGGAANLSVGFVF